MSKLIKSLDLSVRLFSGSIAQTTIKTSAVLFLRLVIQAGSLMAIAHSLGSSQFGIFAAITSAAALFGIISLAGTNLFLLNEFSTDTERGKATLNYILPTFFSASFIFFFVFLVGTITHVGTTELNVSALALIGIAEIILSPLIVLIATYHQANNRIVFSQILTTIPLLSRLTLVIAILFISVNDPLSMLFYGYAISALLSLIVALTLKKINFPSPQLWRFPRLSEFKCCLRFSFLNFFSLAFGEIDKIIAYNLLAANIAGIYAVGTRIIGAITLPIGALIISALPKLFHNDSNKEKIIKLIFISCLIYSLAICLILLITSPNLEQIFDPSFMGLANCLSALTLAIPVITLRITSGFILMSRGRLTYRLIYESIGLISLVILIFLLSPLFGIMGTIASLCISEAFMAIAGWILILKLPPLNR